ncbi:TIGR01244 family sulfur transferase [Microvirga mediterraneensis]|uniref:TIGR01244 family phosphatase n=1 Tax=Microvirga mediterraneensis TaxID=2754695 RepID=A0A838BI12_9HYPH|nr:TIGR01244 family sulfur transferase [Microvirga mediterraneensis]MBA1154603.1 TIGR01244 family phosphatase [Microvirga mediterraneensis]
MPFTTLTDNLSVAPQLSPEDLQQAAAAGFRSIINNRPDGESPDQPLSDTLAAAAHRLGLAYRHIPVVPGGISPDHVDAFREALTSTTGPTLAFCRTGTRSTSLWALASARRLAPDEILRIAADAGYNLEALRPQIEAASREWQASAG